MLLLNQLICHIIILFLIYFSPLIFHKSQLQDQYQWSKEETILYVITSKASTIPTKKSLGLCHHQDPDVPIFPLYRRLILLGKCKFCILEMKMQEMSLRLLCPIQFQTILLLLVVILHVETLAVFGISIGTSTYFGGNETDHQALLAFKT